MFFPHACETQTWSEGAEGEEDVEETGGEGGRGGGYIEDSTYF